MQNRGVILALRYRTRVSGFAHKNHRLGALAKFSSSLRPRGGRVCASWSRAARGDARRRPLRSASGHLARAPRQSRSSARPTLTSTGRYARRLQLAPPRHRLTIRSRSSPPPRPLLTPLPVRSLLPPPPLSLDRRDRVPFRVNRGCVNREELVCGTKQCWKKNWLEKG